MISICQAVENYRQTSLILHDASKATGDSWITLVDIRNEYVGAKKKKKRPTSSDEHHVQYLVCLICPKTTV